MSTPLPLLVQVLRRISATICAACFVVAVCVSAVAFAKPSPLVSLPLALLPSFPASSTESLASPALSPVVSSPVPLQPRFLSSSTEPPASPSASGAKITFRRIFKSSSPEFIEITVSDNSEQATYEIRQLEEDAGSAPFAVNASLRHKMFDLAAQLNHFRAQDLDVHRKIANLGEKTFRWESGAESYETKFNYTLNSAAMQLLQIFEGLARQQEHVILISRRMRYDRLGINDALLQFESDLNRSLLPEPQRALPMLDQIASDPHFVEIARQRARNLAERIRHQS